MALSNLPDDPENVKIFYRDRVEDEAENENGTSENILLSVHKPEFQKCPEPDAVFKEWLLPGWDSYRNEVQVKEFIELQAEEKKPLLSLFGDVLEESEEEPQRELFTDSLDRVKQYESWLARRKALFVSRS